MPTQKPGEHAHAADIRATVEARDVSRPPKITFTFPGLEDPLRLWSELEALHWIVPDRLEPELEIDWDSPEGAGFRVLPYMVEGFEIIADNWPVGRVAEWSLETINLLRRLGVDLDIPIAYLAFLRRTQVALLNDPNRKSTNEIKPTSIPNTLLLSKQPWSVLVDESTVDVYETATSSGQPNWYWTESKRHPDDLGQTVAAQDAVIGSIDLGWELLSRMEAPGAVDGRDRILRFIVQDVKDGSDMLARLQTLAGDRCASMLMRPIRKTGAATNCLLIICVVPSERFADIGSQMIAEFPDAIARGRRYSSAFHENAA